jgi:hypothetical protein
MAQQHLQMAQSGNTENLGAANAFASMANMGMPGLMMPPFMPAGGAQGSSDQQFGGPGMFNPFASMIGVAGFAQQMNQGQNKTHGDDA